MNTKFYVFDGMDFKRGELVMKFMSRITEKFYHINNYLADEQLCRVLNEKR